MSALDPAGEVAAKLALLRDWFAKNRKPAF